MPNQTGFKITDIAAGWNRADFDDVFIRKDCFLDGGLWLWGRNIEGALGTNTTTSHSSPVQTVSGGTSWLTISAGAFHTTVIKTDGSLWLWGCGANGRLGTNTTINQSSPVQTVSGGTNWRSVSTGDEHTTAIKTDGSLWLWGLNTEGQLGNNDINNQSSPVQTISGGNNWRSVSAGNVHTAAIKTDGSLWLWGCGGSGQLGNNATGNQSSPVQTISGGNNWRSVSAGFNHTAAIKTDGSLWLWGSGGGGRLGNGANINQSSPVQTVSGGTNWRNVSGGIVHTTAIKTDGTLWLWGCNSNGQLGDNTTINKSSPVQTISGGNNWRLGISSNLHTTAIKTDGTLWLWGLGSYGELGNNSIENQSSPIQTISGGTNWRKISGEFSRHTVAIREDCW
jgi:alpha-tubulin suppressor-like RCC1 family protein